MCKLLVLVSQRTRPLTSSPVSQSRVLVDQQADQVTHRPTNCLLNIACKGFPNNCQRRALKEIHELMEETHQQMFNTCCKLELSQGSFLSISTSDYRVMYSFSLDWLQSVPHQTGYKIYRPAAGFTALNVQCFTNWLQCVPTGYRPHSLVQPTQHNNIPSTDRLQSLLTGHIACTELFVSH